MTARRDRRTHGPITRSLWRAQFRGAFSLVELVIVIVVIGIVAAIAVPRLTRGATQAGAAALRSDLATLNRAVELYRAEHEGRAPTATHIGLQLTNYSNAAGNALSATADPGNGIVFGPYLREIPAIQIGPNKGATRFAAVPGDDIAWLYTGNGATILPNLFDDSMAVPDSVIDQLNTTRDELEAAIETGDLNAVLRN